MSEVSRILLEQQAGDPRATEQLLQLVYTELRELAALKLAQEKPGQTLQATALVHEVYLRLVGSLEWEGRGHFFAAAAEAMRRILIEQSRRKHSEKRGGNRQRVEMVIEPPAPDGKVDLLVLDEALERLAARDRQAAELVKLRYFAGLTAVQAAAALGIPERTADRIWVYARSFLLKELAIASD